MTDTPDLVQVPRWAVDRLLRFVVGKDEDCWMDDAETQLVLADLRKALA